MSVKITVDDTNSEVNGTSGNDIVSNSKSKSTIYAGDCNDPSGFVGICDFEIGNSFSIVDGLKCEGGNIIVD